MVKYLIGIAIFALTIYLLKKLYKRNQGVFILTNLFILLALILSSNYFLSNAALSLVPALIFAGQLISVFESLRENKLDK